MSELAPRDLRDQIIESIKSGIVLALDYEEILAQAAFKDGPVAHAKIEIGLALDSVNQLAGVIGGQPLFQLVPKSLIPAGAITLQSLGVTLFTESKSLGGVTCVVAFGDHGRGLEWPIAKINDAQLAVTLETIAVSWVEPGKASQLLSATATGTSKIATLDLDVLVTYPDASITFQQPSSQFVNLATFFSEFGFPAASFLNELFLRDFFLGFDFADKSLYLSGVVSAGGQPSVTLIRGSRDGPSILSFTEMSFDFVHAPGATDATIAGQLIAMDKLALGVRASHRRDGSWSFSGQIDIPSTWRLLHPGEDPRERLSVTLADFAEMFAQGVKVPDVLTDLGIGIAELSVDYTYVDEDSKHWTFKGVFDGEWDIAGGISAELGIHLTDTTKKVSAAFDMEGFGFELGYEFGETGIITAAINATIGGRTLAIDGTYNVDKKTLILHFASDVNLALLLSWFVREATGNRYFTLPEPWNGIFEKVSLPKQEAEKLTFTINAAEKSVACSYGLENSVDFFGFSLEGFKITYSSEAKSKGGSGLQISIEGQLPPELKAPWDPGTEQPQAVPGHGAALLEIQLAAVGQHIGFEEAPESVEDAVGALADALDPEKWRDGELFPDTMVFSRDVGWLLGSHLKILAQVDVQLIFIDPEIYGLLLQVEESKGNGPTKLDALKGLRAEILYRKVSETIGEYQGTLTLPDEIAKIDYNTLQITLPSIALAIYTNGDFMIDVGFPHNRDFSRSFSITGGIYSGAGGFYYAKLDGLDPSTLPQVPDEVGTFNPVTEIGIGFRIGMVRGFSSGPLSAQLSIMLQALFEGTFATFTLYKENRQDEYYAVRASVAVIGRLTGRIDLEIIQATVEVTLYVEVDLALIAHRKALAEVSVGVSVKVSLKINCGFFSIHIHVSFETTIRQQITFGEDTPALWDQPQLAARAALAMAAAPPRVGWQPIADDASLTVYFIPQLTAGLAYPAPDGEVHWYYVGQLALSNPAPQAGEAIKLANAAAPSYAKLVRGVLMWSLHAIDNEGGETPVSKTDAEAKRVSRAQIEGLLEALSDAGLRDIRPKAGDVRGLFKHGFRTTICRPQKVGNCRDLSVGFFPILPGMEVQIQAGQQDARRLAATAPLSQAQLRRAKESGPADALAATTFGGPGADAAALDEAAQSIQAHLLIDYLMLALRSGLQKVLDLPDLFEHDGDQKTIGQLLGALDDSALGSISGMTTRFMLHGTRLPAEEGDALLQPLYALTGQQAKLGPEDLAADSLAMTVTWQEDALADWAATFEDGGTSLTLSSADPDPVMFSPAQIPETPTFDLSDVTSDVLPAADIRPVRFHLKSGIDGPETEGAPVSLWRLPPSLLDQLSDPESADLSFDLHCLKAREDEGEPVQPDRYAWALAVDFRVRRIPEPDAAGGEAYLENTYELVGVDQAGLLRLEQLIAEIEPETGKGPVAKLELAYLSEEKPAYMAASGQDVEGHALTLADVDFRNTFMVQSNFSTESRPPEGPRTMAMVVGDDRPKNANFIYKLWTGGITNSGGCYLFHAPGTEGSGLSPNLFAGGTATLTLIVHLALASPGPLPRYVTGVRTRGYPVQGAAESLYVAADALQAAHPTLRPGEIGVRVKRPVPADPDDEEPYDRSLGQLYNLISGRIAKIGDQERPLRGLPALIGPLDEDDDAAHWHYRHVFPTVPVASSTAKAALPPDDRNPYRRIGETVSFELRWTDLYGNQWGASSPALDATLGYFDPLVSLHQLPYLILDYSFEPRAGDDPALVIDFRCLMPTYEETDSERKRNDLAAYAAAYYQLTPTAKGHGIESSVETSLVTGAGLAVETENIRSNITAIYAQLSKMPLGGAVVGQSVPLKLKSLSVAVPTSDSAFNQGLYFPLTVSLVLQRNGPIDTTAEVPSDSGEGGKAPGPVRRVSVAIAPRMAGKTRSLAAFAEDFQAAFSAHDLLLAVGSSWRQGGIARSHQVWAVRYGAKGIKFSFTGEAAYFAPRPLSNKLLSRRLPVRRVESDGTLSSEATELSVADIDLDAEMKRFLAAVDRMFTPENAIPATLVNGLAIDRLSRSKKDVVEQLVGYVTNLTENDVEGSTLKAAQERYRQECLIRLEAFYDMASVAVTPVKTEFGVPHKGAPLNVFGHPIRKNVTKNNQESDPNSEVQFSLTSGKCTLSTDTPAPMAIGLFAKQKSHYKRYRAELEFTLDALEHDIETVTLNDTDHAVGSWLRFVDPQPPLPMADVSIPIPLRAFPEPPQLTHQFAKPLIQEAGVRLTEAPNLLLKRAKSWALSGRYRQDYAAQDKVHLDVQLNIGLDGAPRALAMATREKDLLDTLVEFNQLYPQLQDLFDKHDLCSIRTPEQAEGADELRAALQSFATLVESVACCSRTLTRAPRAMAMQLEDTGLIKRRSRYAIEDGIGVMSAENEWQTTVTFEGDIDAPVGIVPQLLIDGYETRASEPRKADDGEDAVTYRFESQSEPGTYLKAADAWRIPSRTAAIPALNIVDRQNGLLSMMIRRNEDLPAVFHYETPWVTYNEKVAPLLEYALPIQMAGLGAPLETPARRSLEDHLTAFFSALLAGSGTGDAPTGSFQALAVFDYPSNSNLSLSPISLPITLRLPSEVTFGLPLADAPDYVIEMAEFIATWLDSNELTPTPRKDLWAASRLRFDVSLFARVSETGQPILRLRNVLLPCEFIKLN